MIPADVIQQVAINGIFTGLLWLAIKRPLDRETRERENLQKEVKDLGDRRIVNLENDLAADGARRKLIYERLEEIRLDWMSKKECRDMHTALTGQLENYMAAVMKLERVATEVARLVGWVNDISKEQIGAGKDIAALAAQIQILYEKKGKNHDAG